MTSKNLYNLKDALSTARFDARYPTLSLFDRVLTAFEELEARLTILEREQEPPESKPKQDDSAARVEMKSSQGVYSSNFSVAWMQCPIEAAHVTRRLAYVNSNRYRCAGCGAEFTESFVIEAQKQAQTVTAK